MKAKIRKNKGAFEVAIQYKEPMTDKIKFKRVKVFQNEFEANIFCIEVQKNIDKNNTEKYEILSKVSVEDIILNYCIEQGMLKEQARKDKKSINTIKTYKNNYEKHIKNNIGKYKVSRITAGILQDFIDELAKDYSKSTINIIKSIISTGMNYAVIQGYIDRDYSKDIKIWGKSKKNSSSENYLTTEELKKVFDITLGTDLGLQIMISAVTGLRISSVLAISEDRIDFKNKKILIDRILVKDEENNIKIQNFTKNKENIIVSIPEILEEQLKEYIENNREKRKYITKNKGMIFLDRKGNLLDSTSVSHNFKNIMKKIGKENVTFHGLRHSYATLLYEQGLPLEMISKVLNHKTLQVTQSIYTHLTDKTRDDVASKLNTIFS